MADVPKDGIAHTFDEDSPGDVALLKLAKAWWFKIFLFISFGLALSEPFLVAFPQTIPIQKIILAISSGLFVLGYLATMIAISSESVPEGFFLKRLYFRFRYSFLPEMWIEIFSFVIGWALIFEDPGIACLRCFRVFRFVWYTEFYLAKKGTIFFPITFFCHLVLQYLEKIGQELFTLSSKGGVVVLGFFFYMAYIMGVSFWQKTGDLLLASPEGGPNGTLSECDTLPHCFLIMLRLTFWDGSGFDFVKSLIDVGNQKGLVTLLIIYMCTSAMVLLNGLIGIFGGAFSAATEDSDDEGEDEDSDKKDEKDEKDEKGEKEGDEDEEMNLMSKDPNKVILEYMARIEKLCTKLEGDVKELKQKYAKEF